MTTANTLVIAQYRHDSDYADIIGTRYHFPRKYLNMLSLAEVHFLYFEPKKKGEGVFFGYGQIGSIAPDPNGNSHYFASIDTYRSFPDLVSGYNGDGTPIETAPYYNAQNAVRRIDSALFHDICRAAGLKLRTWSY